MQINFDYNVITGLVAWSFDNNALIEYDYRRDKGRWVVFNNGKDNLKLRQYIKLRATHLSQVSNGNYFTIRKIFIEAYNIGGTESVEIIYKESVLKILKSLN